MVALVLLLTASYDPDANTPPAVSDVAPSLPATTRAEEDRFDAVIDRFILADTGKLRGDAARKAVADFDGLKPAAIPALIRGLNRAARINHSCPILMIGKKLARMLLSSQDPVLLDFARDELQGSATGTPHAGAVQNLRVQLMLRKNALERLPLPPRSLAGTPTAGLITLSAAEAGERKKAVLAELGKRDGRDAMLALARAANAVEGPVKLAARDALYAHLGRQSESSVKEAMTDPGVELRKSAVRVAAGRPEMTGYVIERLTDERADVRAEARAALVKLAGKEDFGPDARATKAQQEAAKAKWRAWWEKRNGGTGP
ncbi:MAG: hypothetical protein ACRC33_30255 [Gemmataceae bacterium]